MFVCSVRLLMLAVLTPATFVLAQVAAPSGVPAQTSLPKRLDVPALSNVPAAPLAPVAPSVPVTPTPIEITPPNVPVQEEFKAARAILVTKRELTAQLQIFLDQKLFSPGMIDGKEGRFLREALKRWQRANGLPETGKLDAHVPLDSIHPVYTFHTVDAREFKHLGEVPGQPSAQAKRKKLPYSNYQEYLAERYHCSPDFLQRLNPSLKFASLQPGQQVRVPNVEPFKIEEMPATGNYPEYPELKTRRIVINRKDTILELYDGEKLIASVPIAPGSPANPTPPGNWKILGVAAMPTFRWDKGVLDHGVRTSNYHMLPPGPNNPVGVGWIGLNKPGIGIHGTNNPHSIGTWASHGCMRSANWDIARLSRLVTKGVAVEIQ